ncbi:pyridoxal-phosphate-dependent aminotransferase family protein [Pseudooceanicola nanhaiensis]|uniref:pyridoxal-phosphate-dependent aminotransferase family protein n=1 Tax=Pseudooceanicola nanhaiensis TaxID=375761 RepID=UPI001CD77EDC|nr:aminotransferase class V-fold PLP-dependent enzyme [Pseudooceanicola nanhaiensis]MCA0922002.1 aminotransferase class V-fold PLP-dependent enzyme [Pseudooceanicola nanhaiensis]
MSLANGRTHLAIPGPSIMPDAVLQAMHRAAPNIYEGDIVTLVEGLIPDLRKVARTEHAATIYIGNGHAVWEASLVNVINPGDKVLVAATGRFGHGWAGQAAGVGADVQVLDFGLKAPLDAQKIEDALRADTNHEIKAVLVNHVDTATSILNDVPSVRAAIDAAGHPALLMADCIASMACDRFEMDAWGVDIAITGSQKGLMVPPGLGFVFFGPKAKEAREKVERVSLYWDWKPRSEPAYVAEYFGGTSPTHHLFGLRAALDIMHGEGMENVWARHDSLARALWAACDAWGQGGPLTMNVADPAHRSRAVTALSLGGDKGERLRKWCAEEAGLTLGIGLGMAPRGSAEAAGFFRIGHMGHLNAHVMLGTLGTIEAGLTALDIPHGAGALSAAAKVIAAG